MKNGLEVFDFKEEEELPEYAPGKITGKFKDPSLDNPVVLKCELFECVALGSDIAKNEIANATCVDADPNECDNSSKNSTTAAPLELLREEFITQDTNGGPDSVFQLQSPSHQNEPCPKMDTFESKSSFIEHERRVSCDGATSPGKSQSNCAPGVSLSNSEFVNVKSNADGSINENSPSSPTSSIAKDGAILDGRSSDSCLGAPEMDIINIAVDYVSYRDNYITGCVVTFSCGGVKISGMPAYGEQESFCFERGIGDIIRIESHYLQRFGTVTVKLHMLPKGAAQDANASGVEQLEFAVVEACWSAKLEEIGSLNPNYLAVSSIFGIADLPVDSGAELLRQRPYFPIFGEAVEDVVYPKGDSDAVSISKRDFDLLQPETFINDTIIDFYIKYLKNQIPPEERHRFYFFNSFFFRKLADLDKDPSSASDGRAAFLRVHKWTRKVDIFGKDYIFIPVNFNLHWSLLVICHPGDVAGLKDADSGSSLRVPCILHMDSIKGTHAGLKNLVQSYLWEEWKVRQKDASEDLSTKFLHLRFVPLELPQQENSFDCGLFLLHYLEIFLAEAPLDFNPFKINQLSEFLNVDWFPPAEASLKRTLIQRLISGLLESHSQELSSGSSSDEPDSSCPENNEKETAVQLVSGRCISGVACHGTLSRSDANQGIEMTLLEAASARNSGCVNDPGLVLRDFLEPGVTTGSLLAQCSSFDQPSFYNLNGAMSQQIEDTETGEPLMYFPSGDAMFQQIAGMTPQTGSIPYSLKGFGADLSWHSGLSEQGEDDASSPETSICASDDSDVGIIESCPVLKGAELCQRNKVDERISQSTKDIKYLSGKLASGSSDMLETSAMEVTEDLDRMNDGDENRNLAFCPRNPTTLHEDPKLVENGLDQHSNEAEINRDDVQTVVDDVMAVTDEKHKVGDNTVAEAYKHQTIGNEVMVEPEEKQTTSSNVMGELDEKHRVESNVIAESDENQTVDEHISKSEKQTDVYNVTGESNEKQMIDGTMMEEPDEQQQAKKRRRVTPTNEGEDLHL